MTIWDAPDRFGFPTSLYPCCRPPRPPCPPKPDCPEPCDEEYSVKVMGCDACGNLILCVKRPRHCWCNGEWVPSRRWR